jgi:hypothetical protein
MVDEVEGANSGGVMEIDYVDILSVYMKSETRPGQIFLVTYKKTLDGCEYDCDCEDRIFNRKKYFEETGEELECKHMVDLKKKVEALEGKQ